MLFEKDSVILKEEAKENIFMLVKNNYSPEHELFFQIEGHVDKLHNTAPGYDNSWSFAAARAENVLNFLLGESDLLHKDFKKAHFSVVSFGEYQPKYRYEENQEKSSNGRIEVRMFRSP
jgi:flagellar motor protein MotB